MAEQMSIDLEKVTGAINQITDLLGEIQKKNSEFIKLLEEANQKTKNQFKLTITLEDRVREEANALNRLVDTNEQIRQTLDAYADAAEAVQDDSAFRV